MLNDSTNEAKICRVEYTAATNNLRVFVRVGNGAKSCVEIKGFVNE